MTDQECYDPVSESSESLSEYIFSECFSKTPEEPIEDLTNHSDPNVLESIDNANDYFNDLVALTKKIEKLSTHGDMDQTLGILNQLEAVDDAKSYFDAFVAWMSTADKVDLYKNFVKRFDENYRAQLYKYISKFFKMTTIVTDDIIYYWKLLIIDLVNSSKRYKHYADEITIDAVTKTTPLTILCTKEVFACYQNDVLIFYFKESNGDYYLS